MICKNGHTYNGVKCYICKNKVQRKSKDLPRAISEQKEDELLEEVFTPKGDNRGIYNLGFGNRWVSRKGRYVS